MPILSEADQRHLQRVPSIEETHDGQEKGPNTRILGFLDQETIKRILHGDIKEDISIDEELLTLIEKVEMTTTKTMIEAT